MNATGIFAIVLAIAGLSACASQEEHREQPVTEAIRDFISVRQLAEVDTIATGSTDGWETLNEDFILYNARRDTYLVEFVRRCHELYDNTRITPDRRWDSNYIRARFDTIRGCRIANIYELTEAEVAELQNIGETPGSRN